MGLIVGVRLPTFARQLWLLRIIPVYPLTRI
jgi:hypothetical protein